MNKSFVLVAILIVIGIIGVQLTKSDDIIIVPPSSGTNIYNNYTNNTYQNTTGTNFTLNTTGNSPINNYTTITCSNGNVCTQDTINHIIDIAAPSNPDIDPFILLTSEPNLNVNSSVYWGGWATSYLTNNYFTKSDYFSNLTSQGYVTNSTAQITESQVINLVTDLAGVNTIANTANTSANSTTVQFIIGDGVDVITPGIYGVFNVPWDATLLSVRQYADQSGSMSVSLEVNTSSNYIAGNIPTIADSLGTFDLINAWGMANDALSDSIPADDMLQVNVTSASTVKRVTVFIKLGH